MAINFLKSHPLLVAFINGALHATVRVTFFTGTSVTMVALWMLLHT